MTTDTRTELRALISTAKAAIRDCEKDPVAGTLSTVFDALHSIPGSDLDRDAFEALDEAARLVSGAITGAETGAVINLHMALHVMQHEGPQEKPEEEPTVAEVIALTAMCRARFEKLRHFDMAKSAWERAYRKGVAALGVLMRDLPDAEDINLVPICHAVDAFVADVHRAVAYRPLFEARNALVKAADAAGLFVIGGRQPAWGLEGRGWRQRIGGAEYRFEVTGPRPLDRAPGGLILVTRVDLETGQESPRHVLARRFEYGPKRADEDAALARI
ncbi:hypothetical protein AB0G49_14195 [Streptomyces longwoodensis]|uniref:hypothetical protein n=1 Tax=Streptomyces longwoodensis TaxID=68231 RepID=UPI0033ECCAFA